jgi:hypothetical protein
MVKFFGKNKTSTTTNNTNNDNTYPISENAKGRKYKPYRNRPSMRQVILEILSFFLILAAAPAFLGGTIGIFIMFFTLVLGLIGLFAWTRRHALLFVFLAVCIIALCIVNIILRATGSHPFGNGQCLPYWSFDNNGFFANNNEFTNANGNFRSIWCGDKYFVYIVDGIIILLAIPALLMALLLLGKRRNVNTATTTTETKQTKTIATA